MSTSRSALLAGILLLGAAAPLRGQGDQPDPRWQAWLGCWLPADAAAPEPGKAPARRVCVIPSPDASSVDVVTVADTLVISRERLDASDAPRQARRERCTGWERARWSEDGRRLYLSSEYVCGGGGGRRSSGLMAISPGGEWLDVRSVTVGGRTGVRVLRSRAADPSEPLPSEIAAALEVLDAEAGLSRVAAAAPLTTADVAEASRQVDPQVVVAWLAERREGFAVNARRLTELADAGVPGDVIDIVVALSYPRVFSVGPAAPQGGVRRAETGDECRPDGWGACGPYGYSPYGYSPYHYGPYGHSPFGAWGGYYGGGVIITAEGAQAPGRGRLVHGRGYTQSAGTGVGVEPNPQRDRDSSPAPSSGSSQSASGSSGASSSGRSPSSSTSSGSGSSTGRTAQPRPPR